MASLMRIGGAGREHPVKVKNVRGEGIPLCWRKKLWKTVALEVEHRAAAGSFCVRSLGEV
jgi:hypothetical protein